MNSVTQIDTEMVCAARSVLYGLLQRVFSEVPDDALHERESSSLVVEALSVYADLSASFGLDDGDCKDGVRFIFSIPQVKEVDSLEGVYNRLFVGVGKPEVCVWESIYLTGSSSLFQRNTLDVRNFYANFGLQSRDHPYVADDHIAIELAFLRELSIETISSAVSEERRKALLVAQREFLDDHLGKWAASFRNQVKEHDSSKYYAHYANMLVAFIRVDRKLLAVL